MKRSVSTRLHRVKRMLHGSQDKEMAGGLCPGVCGRALLHARRNAGTEGQALVEFAAVVPLLFLLVVLAMNFGGLIGAWVAVANATRAAADYAILSGDSAGSPTLATTGTSGTLAA